MTSQCMTGHLGLFIYVFSVYPITVAHLSSFLGPGMRESSYEGSSQITELPRLSPKRQ
jgi:hypothetical protein